MLEPGKHLHLVAGREVWALATDAELRNILAVERVAQIREMHGLGLLLRLLVRIRGRVHRELLVVAQGVDGALGQESCMMYRAVVDDLHQRFVLV